MVNSLVFCRNQVLQIDEEMSFVGEKRKREEVVEENQLKKA